MKATPIRMSQADYRDAEGMMLGYCVTCGEEGGESVEPDARKYPCDRCGTNTVYGAQELLLMGLITFTDEDA